MTATDIPGTDVGFHFCLKPGKDYTLKAFGRAYSLLPHTAETLSAYPEANAAAKRPTHYAQVTQPPADMIQLIRVYGPPDPDGIPSLVSLAIYTPQTVPVYSTDDLARAIVFLHPNLTVLTAEHANTVLNHIASSSNWGQMSFTLENLSQWNTTIKLQGETGQYLRDPAGKILYRYDLVDQVTNLRTAVAQDTTIKVNNDPRLQDIRWSIQNGKPFIDISPGLQAARNGYEYQLQDPGPEYGISAQVLDFTDDLQLKIRLSNNYIRHCSTFVSFLAGDGKTAIIVPDNIWTTLAEAAVAETIKAWQRYIGIDIGLNNFIFDHTNTLKFLGTLGAESTFLGIPVSSGSSDYTFKLPGDGSQTISKIRVLCGSLGTPSGNDWDPQAAWIGIGLTALLDLLIPTIALIASVGTVTNKVFDAIFKDIKFIAPAIAQIALAIKDIVENPDATGNDLTNLFVSLSNSVAQKVLSAVDVAAALAGYFGAEEAAEAVPFVGWALKAEAIEATIEQLAQTVGEVVGSQRIVEFDITVTLSMDIILLPDDVGGFPATATSYTITAHYSDLTCYVYNGVLADPKVDQLALHWEHMPIGGKVTLIVAFYSKEGWLVGRGQSPSVHNLVTPGKSALIMPPIKIEQILYPLTDKTTYGQSQILEYLKGTHTWVESSTPPSETVKELGSGSGGHLLEYLSGIGLNSDLGILGYCWQATGQGVPLIGADSAPPDVPVFTFQNISFGPNPESALMFTPKGYNTSPQIAYLRSAIDVNDAIASLPSRSFFYLDPIADPASAYHLRGISPVTDGNIPINSPARLFDLSTEMSWGRFQLLPTSMAVHPTGCVVAVAAGFSKLMILDLGDAPVASEQAPWAQFLGGPGTREGLLQQPQLVAIAPNQTILVLEAGNLRIQAFSRGGHPTRAFAQLATPYWIPLFTETTDSASATWTSMSIDVKGYIYLLSYEDDGYVAEQFRLDIYTPTGGHLLRQRGINVAAMTVDLWRNMYTLNYQTILGPGNRTEPSVSEWIPSTPKG